MPPVIAFVAAVLIEVGVGATTAAFIASAVVNLAIGIGISAIASLIAGGPKKPALHAQRETLKSAIMPRRFYMGRVKISGAQIFVNVIECSDAGFTNVNALHFVLALGEGEFDYIEEHWIGDAHVFLNSSNVVIMPVHFNNNGTDTLPFVRIYSYTGTQTQVVDPLMSDDFPSQWTGPGKGIAYTVLRAFSPDAEHFNAVFPAGIPTYSALCRTSKFWDPRDPDQVQSDPSTWRYSSNGVLGVLDRVLSPDGLNLPVEMVLPAIEVWKMEADYCDRLRILKNGGSEAWYRLCGGYEFSDAPKTWLPKMLNPMDARLAMRADGAVVIDVGRWREPELTIADNELYSYKDFAKGKQKSDIRNKIDATFVAEDYGYSETAADSWLNEDSIDIDGVQQGSLDLTWAPSHAQARTRMKIEAYRQDPDGWNGTIITKAYGLKFLTANSDGSRKRFVRFQISELGIDDTFEVQSFAFDHKTGRCSFSVIQMGSEAFDWDKDADEGNAPLIAPNTNTYGFEDPFNLQISVSSDVITATIDTPTDTGLNLALDYRLTADAAGDWEVGWTELTHSGWGGHTGTLDDGRYDIRVRFYDSRTPPRYSNPRWIRGIIIGTGNFVGSVTAPSDFDVNNVPDDFTVDYTYTTPSDPSFHYCTIWVAAGGGSVFADASITEARIYSAPGDAVDQISTHDFAPGTYNWWITATDLFGNTTAPAGPVTLTVTF